MQTSLLTHLLADVLVLVETLLCQVALAEIHAQLQVLEHNGLVDLLPCSMFLTFDDIVQNIQGWLLFANLKELYTHREEQAVDYKRVYT